MNIARQLQRRIQARRQRRQGVNFVQRVTMATQYTGHPWYLRWIWRREQERQQIRQAWLDTPEGLVAVLAQPHAEPEYPAGLAVADRLLRTAELVTWQQIQQDPVRARRLGIAI